VDTTKIGTTQQPSAFMASSSPPARTSSDHGANWQSLDSFLESTQHVVADVDSERWVLSSYVDLIPSWQAQAHCTGVGHDMYFGNEHEQPTMSIKQVRNAAKLCDVCPVFEECFTHALTVREEYGVWAGTSGRTRRRLFSLLDRGETTIEELVEVTLNGRQPAPNVIAFPGAYEAGDGLADEGDGLLAL
jgi:WhiB family transcriptional regulator, redox-sensing transcriptional regulator